VAANFHTNSGESIRRSTANQFAQTNSRFSYRGSELCYYAQEH